MFKSKLHILLTVLVILISLYFGVNYLQGNRWIVFYGRVVSEDGKGIPDVQLNIGVNKWDLLQFPLMFLFQSHNMHMATSEVKTDRDGYFAIYPGMGDSIHFASLTRDKKWAMIGLGPKASYYYSSIKAPPHLIHHPDPNDPVVFTMREYHGPR